MVCDLAHPESEVWWDPCCPSGWQSSSPGIPKVESRKAYASRYIWKSYHELALGKENKGKGREGRRAVGTKEPKTEQR